MIDLTLNYLIQSNLLGLQNNRCTNDTIVGKITFAILSFFFFKFLIDKLYRYIDIDMIRPCINQHYLKSIACYKR